MSKRHGFLSLLAAGCVFIAAFLCGCLPKESLELRPGVRWEYVDSTHSKLVFETGEVLGPAHISLQVRDDCIFGLYHAEEKTSIFMFEFKSRKLFRNMESYEALKYDLHFEQLYSQMEILGEYKAPEKIGRLLRGEPNEESK